jgi:hypothetical protein
MEKHLLIPENESEIMRVSFESNQDLFFLRSKRPSMNWLKRILKLVAKGIESISKSDLKKVVLEKKLFQYLI